MVKFQSVLPKNVAHLANLVNCAVAQLVNARHGRTSQYGARHLQKNVPMDVLLATPAVQPLGNAKEWLCDAQTKLKRWKMTSPLYFQLFLYIKLYGQINFFQSINCLISCKWWSDRSGFGIAFTWKQLYFLHHFISLEQLSIRLSCIESLKFRKLFPLRNRVINKKKQFLRVKVRHFKLGVDSGCESVGTVVTLDTRCRQLKCSHW